MKTIMVKNGKGGDGKTAIAVNLSAYLADKGYRVLAIDSDQRAHLSTFFTKNVPVTGTTYGNLGDWLLKSKKNEEVIQKTNLKNLDIIVCNDDLDQQVKELERNKFLNIGGTQLKEQLDTVKGVYDYCIIDCSQNADTMAVYTFIASDLVLIPVRSVSSSLSGLRDMIMWINQLKEIKPKLDYKVIINDKERNKESESQMKECELLVGNKLCRACIRHQSKPMSMSIRLGEPVVSMHRTASDIKKQTIVDDLKAVFEEVLL